MKRLFHAGQVVSHPSTLAVFSGLFVAVIAFLINFLSGGNTSGQIVTALVFALLLSLCLAAWQMYTQDQSGKQWMAMMQEMVFQTCFQTLLTDNPEISQIAQQRLCQVLKTLEDDQQLSMLKFFSHNGLPATFIGDGLRASKALVEADLQKIVLPRINLARTDLRRVNFNVKLTAAMHQRNGEIAQGCHHLWSMAGAQTGAVFSKGHIPHVMKRVLVARQEGSLPPARLCPMSAP
jgi:type II secretory pathway pseudopilin PulG